MTRQPWIRCGMPGSTEPMHGLGDLALALDGSENSWIGELLKLIAKAQGNPERTARLALAFPRYVRAWQLWFHWSPTPTRDEFLAVLDTDPSIEIGETVVVSLLTGHAGPDHLPLTYASGDPFLIAMGEAAARGDVAEIRRLYQDAARGPSR